MTTSPVVAEHKVTFCHNEWRPHAFVADGNSTGITVEIVRAAARKLGREVVFFNIPWKRCLQMVQEGEIDGLLDAAQRDTFLQGPTSFNSYSDVFWVRQDAGISTPADLRGRTIGLVEGYDYATVTTGLMTSLALIPERTVDDYSNVKMLAFERVDAIVADLVSTAMYVKEHDLRIKPLLPAVHVDPLYISFNLEKKDLQARFDGAFRQLIDDGTVRRINAKFVDPELLTAQANP